MDFLKGKKGLVVGVANEHSVAAGCVKAFHAAGAEVALTYLNDKSKSYVEPFAQAVDAAIFESLDVTQDGALDKLFSRIGAEWGELDFVLHSIAWCPKDDLHGRVTDCSCKGFAEAMDVSLHSPIRMARHAEPLMKNGG